MKTQRLEKIKSARSLNDIVDIIKDIAFEFKNSKTAVGKIVTSTSAELTFDVRKQMQPGTTGKETAFVAPKLGELQKHVDVIYKMYDNVVELDAAEAMIKQSFAGNKNQKAVLDSISKMKKDIDDSLNDAFDALGTVAEKHMPKMVSKMADALTSHLIDVVSPKSYSNIITPRQKYVVPDPENRTKFQFCEYIGIEGLKNSSGHAYAIYYFILTCVIDKTGNFEYFVTGLPDFKVPGRYPLGENVKDVAAAKRRVDKLLSFNKFVTDFEKQPLGFDKKRADEMGLPTIKGIKLTDVKDDELIVVLEASVKTSAAEQKVITDVLARLSSVVGAQKNSKIFTYTVGKYRGSRAIKFMLIPNVDKNAMHFSLQHMQEVSETLGLNEKQQKALRFALQH